jgi:hypothetical protein
MANSLFEQLTTGCVRAGLELSARALIWNVKAPSGLAMTPGFLQEVYVADTAVAQRNAAPLTGQTNAPVILLDITDAQQLAGAAGKQKELSLFVILLSLKPRSTPL